MSTSSIPDVLDAIYDGLTALSALRGVGVFTAPAGDSAPLECIEMGEISIDESALSMGGYRNEVWTVEGQVLIVKPGAGERMAVTARDRAFTIFAALETYFNDDPTIAGTCTDCDIVTAKVVQVPTPEGRVCQLQWSLSVRSIINP